MMRTSETILNRDMMEFFKYHKRHVFNVVLDKSGKNPFPQGKKPPYRYYQLINELFRVFKKPLYTKLLCGSTPISDRTTIKTMPDGTKLTVQTGVKFDDFMWLACIKDPKLSHHFKRISDCYKAAYDMMSFARYSGHEDLAVKCNPQHIYYMRKVFDRFSLNRRCIERDMKAKEPYMIIIHHKDSKS